MPISMARSYSEQTEGALLCINSSLDWASDCISSLPSRENHYFIDYGAADGGTAVHFWESCITSFRKKFENEFLTLIGNDLPSNNNEDLIVSLNNQIHNDKFATLLSARSFYDQLVPPSLISFGFSATAMHWLSKPVNTLLNHTHVQASSDKDSFKNFLRQAKADWDHILFMRSKELCKGGRYLFLNLSRDSENKYLGNNGGKTLNVHDQIHQIWFELLEENIISKKEYENGTIQNFYKSADEFIEPLINSKSKSYSNGLRLVKERTVYIDCPYKARWLINRDDNNFSRQLMETIRSWSMHSFNSAIEEDIPRDLSPVDILYQRLENRIKNSPIDWSLDYVEHQLVIEKI